MTLNPLRDDYEEVEYWEWQAAGMALLCFCVQWGVFAVVFS